jgi:flavin-dependent amine oxidoreductase
MTAALKLLEAGFTVRVLEASSSIGGQFGAVPGKNGFHDFAWHVFAEWCLNFWKLVDTIGLRRDVDFVPRPTTILLRPLATTSTLPRAVRVASVGSPETFWSNAASGVAHWSDVMLYAYAQAMLLVDEDLEHEEFLNRVTLNGYVRSLPYHSDVAALLQNELLLRVWAIPSYLISARAYQTYLQLTAPFNSASATLFVLRKNFEEGFWQPFLATLNRFPGFSLVRDARLTGIRLTEARDRVDEILIRRAGESASRREKVRSLIVAIPSQRLLDVVRDADSLALRQCAPGLLGLSKLGAQHTASLTLHFKRRIEIPGVDEEPVALVDDLETIYAVEDLAPRNGLASEYGISFMDIGRLRGAGHPTVLTVLASDVEPLIDLGDKEACERVLADLRSYVEFDVGDIDWESSHYRSQASQPLFVNAVGTWEYRPEVRLTNSRHQPLVGQIDRTISNLYLAGDYCRSQIDVASLEAAMHTGIWAAHALSLARRAAGDRHLAQVAEPIRPVKFDPQQHEEARRHLERWAPLASRRSRLVKDDLLAAAKLRRRLPAASGAPAPTPTIEEASWARGVGGGTMSTAYSTYPAFATPTPTGNAEWFKQRFQESAAPTKPITLKSGAVVPIPLLFWDARALCIEGHADADAFDVLLRDHGLRAARSGSEGTVVQIWAPDYGGTTLGPHKAVYAQVKIEPPRQCRKEEQEQLARRASWHGSTKMSADGGGRVDHWAVWWYYGTSPVNQEFVRDVWGIPNAELATIETSYLSGSRGLRLLEHGGVALRLKIDTGTETGKPAHPVPSLLRMARRGHDTGENWVEVNIRGSVAAGSILRDDRQFHLRKDSWIEKQLTRVSFEPARWWFLDGYEGIVEIWDEKGSGRDPVQDTDDRYEVVKKGDAWLIREFPRTSSERGGTS